MGRYSVGVMDVFMQLSFIGSVSWSELQKEGAPVWRERVSDLLVSSHILSSVAVFPGPQEHNMKQRKISSIMASRSTHADGYLFRLNRVAI